MENSNDTLLELIQRGQGLIWHDKRPVPFDDDWEVDFVIMTRTCEFDEDGSIPNGKFSIGIYGKNTTSTIPIDNFHGEIILDSTKYDCRDPCIFSQQFEITDSDNENNVRTVILDMYDVNNYRTAFDLRTFNVTNDYLSQLLFSSVYVELGILITIIIYVISKRQHKEVEIVLNSISKRDHKQEKYLYEYLEHHLTEFSKGMVELDVLTAKWNAASQPHSKWYYDEFESICRRLFQYNLDLTSDGLFANPYFFTDIKKQVHKLKPALEKWPSFNPPNTEFIAQQLTVIRPMVNQILRDLEENYKERYSESKD